MPTGGVVTGGTSTGGVVTGGTSTGGVVTGGTSTGGVVTGGTSTGGVVTGGTSTGGVLKIPAFTVPMAAITPTSRKTITIVFFMFFTPLRK
jgi:hypothetical protein